MHQSTLGAHPRAADDRRVTATGLDGLNSAARMTARVCGEVARARYEEGDPPHVVSPLLDAVKAALTAVNWSSTDGRHWHVLCRLLCVTPFTASLDPDGKL